MVTMSVISNTEHKNGYDHFSVLPESVFYHICSYLGIKDIGRIASVSKRCRQFFIFGPYLKFVLACRQDPSDSDKMLHDHVDKWLKLRKGLEIRYFGICWRCFDEVCCTNLNLVGTWINEAVNCQVQELDLDISIKYDLKFVFMLPVFASRTLKTLKLNLNYGWLNDHAGVFHSLENLYLEAISVSEHTLKDWISAACPVLKRLTISDFSEFQKLHIQSSSLEELTLIGLPYNVFHINIHTMNLQMLSLDLVSIFPGYLCETKIQAPNLKHLIWTALSPNNTYLSEFKFLNDVKLDVGIQDDYVDNGTVRNRLAKLMQSVHCTERLHLKVDVLEVLFIYNRWPAAFDNLRKMVVNINGLKDYHFPVLATVLMRSPNLECLSLICTEGKYAPYYIKGLKRKATAFYQQYERVHFGMKLVLIEVDFDGPLHQTEPLDALLAAAKGLEVMNICYPKGIFTMMPQSRNMYEHVQVNLIVKS